MCHSDESRPPGARGATATAQTTELVLTSADGTRVMAFEARTSEPSGVGIVVLPDVRGLHAFYKDLAARFAEIGYHAVAFDYFGRTADTDDRSEAFAFRPHVEQTTPAGVAADVQAAAEHLRGLGATSIFTVGFCFGGGYSWRQSADTLGLAGCIGFYGGPQRAREVLTDLQAPLLMLAAGEDQSIPVDEVRRLADAAPVEAELVVFEGAPHSFFDRTYAEHPDAAAEAWRRVRAFVARHA